MSTGTAHSRLRSARIRVYPDSATDAAKAFGIPVQTYLGHENNRGFKKMADVYARRYGVSVEWLLYGKGPRERQVRATPVERQRVPIVGYVSAGVAHFTDSAGDLGDVPAPEGATESTVAVEVRGTSLGEVFDRWIVYYDDVQRPVSQDHIGRLCVVGLADGRILLKQVKKSRGKNLYHLFSNTEPAILDAEVEWAARVRNMVQI